MNQGLALRVLGEIMNWDDARAREEFEWLRLMGDLKYDGYQDFRAGSRFVERLAAWLQQFEVADREVAYAFVRTALVYIGPNEMDRLVQQFYPRTLQQQLVAAVAAERGVMGFEVRADPDAASRLDVLQRQTLFMGLSDGARLDVIRHHHAGVLKNEQFLLGTQVDEEKWLDLLESLRDDLKDSDARFRVVYLLDDFVASGTTFVRWDASSNKWKGKLRKFHESLGMVNEAVGVVDDDWKLCIHHYVASSLGRSNLESHVGTYFEQAEAIAKPVSHHLTFGMTLPPDLPIDGRPELGDMVGITQDYYDGVLRTKHTDVGGVEHLGLGYGGCALPLVLEHNTPNNSIALLWAETSGSEEAHAMVPLFRRRQRHQ